MEKVKEVIAKVTHKDGHAHDSNLAHDSTYNNHSTGTHANGGGLTGSHVTSGQNTAGGLHSSNVGNTHAGQPTLGDKMNPMVDSDRDGKSNFGLAKEGPGAHNNHHNNHPTTHTGQPTLVDKLNPMVDSDRDGKTNFGLAKEGPGAHNNTHNHPNTGTAIGAGTAGVHSNNHPTTHSGQPTLVDKLNPMVDSDRDGKTNFGLAQEGPGGHNNHHNNMGSGVGANNHTHSSHLANQADPRVETSNYGNTQSTNTRIGGNSAYGGATNAGPHSSNVANAIDPRVDSDRSNYGQQSGLTGGNHNNLSSTHGQTGGLTGSSHQPLTDTHAHGDIGHHQHQQGLGGVSGNQHMGYSDGPAPNTAGTHKSDMLNKLDPRIDSDRDGSKTLGSSNQQY